MAINGKPTVISTFAGTGGSSLGYHMAGFQELLAIDFDEDAVEAFKLNFPDVPVWHASVVDVKPDDILRFCKLERGQLDVFDGSPPCQGFSSAKGKVNVNDDRNDLFKEFVRLVDGLQPKVFVMENVSGMIRGKMKGRFIRIMEEVKSMNYEVKAKVLNAMYYGVPQSRERIFFIGVRKDLNKIPVFPTPSPNLVTVADALKTVVNVGHYPPITNAFIRSILHRLKPGEQASKYHAKGSFFNSSRYPLNAPAPTMTKMIPVGGVFHPLENRHISINEAKAICSFPQDWKLSDNFAKAWARLGNAVMPLQMRAIAETIAREILSK